MRESPIREALLDLLSLQDKLWRVTGRVGYLAGGCIRDTVLGFLPKDFDFVIPNPSGWEDHAEVFHRMSVISGTLSLAGIPSSVYAAYEEHTDEYTNTGNDFQDMFLGCMKVSLHGREVDILFSKYKTIEEHIDMHDCNLNQVWLGEDGYVRRQENLAQPLTFREGIGEERQEYMRRKYAIMCRARGLEPRYA